MRAAVLGVVAALSIACARDAIEIPPAGPRLLSLVTWNTHGGRGDLPRLVADLGTPAGPAPDVVLFLQEVVEGSRSDPRMIAQAKGWSVFFVPVSQDDGRGRGTAIVSSRPLLDPRPIPLPRERRIRTAAAATIEIAGHRLFVVSAHLENRTSWWKGLLASDIARARQADALVQALPAGEGIVGGDFNTWLGPNEPAWQMLLRRFGDTPEPTRIPTFGKRLVLDHVFVDLPRGWRAHSRVMPDTYESDHHPVEAVVGLDGF